MSKPKDYNPYPYPLEELREAEKDFCIQLGNDFYSIDGIMVFPARYIDRVYQGVLNDLTEMLKKGSEGEKNHARWAIARFHIVPLRIH